MSQRHIDANGHLIVDKTVITKASVNPYRGSEIPRAKELGLDPDRIYNLLRCPLELQRALPTFGGLQLLLQHTPVDALTPEKELTVGSIGTEFEFDEATGNVYGSLRVYDQEGIDYIESGKMEQLSAGYAYTADMTAGEYNGVSYDGIMRNIHGNHVAIVERGRIGNDAIVADEMPNEIEEYLMAKQVAMKKGALAKLQAQLGMDSADELKKTILAVHSALALDEDDKEEEKAEDEIEIVEKDDVAEDEDDGPKADKERKELEKTDKDDREAKAEDEDDKDDKKAMDADLIAQDAVSRVTALFEAREIVKPLVGEIACDSAEETYKTALNHVGISTKGVHPSAYKVMTQMALSKTAKTPIAQDSSLYEESSDMFKNIKLG